MLSKAALATALTLATVGASAAPAAAHDGSCNGARAITAVGRVITGTEHITCQNTHQVWDICVALYYRNGLTGGDWTYAAGHCHYEDNTGTGSTKTHHSESESATCNPLNGPVQEWWFGSDWQVGSGLQPHFGGGSTTTQVICV